MFRLAHLSDVHLAPLPPVRPLQLLSKRITGYLNWQLNRAGELQTGTLEGLIEAIQKAEPDHVALTGDLVNLALPQEILRMKHWLADFGAPDWISVVPGNHDTYVPGALRACCLSWRDYMLGDTPHESGTVRFPYLRNRGPVAVIGVNSGAASSPFMATGRFGRKQRDLCHDMLDKAALAGKFRVVMIHHPPFEKATDWHKRLIGQSRFRSMIADLGAELILHGHTHLDTQEVLNGPFGPVPVIGVPSASQSLPASAGELAHRPASRFNLFSISGEPGSWSCMMEEYGYSANTNGVHCLSQRQLYPNS